MNLLYISSSYVPSRRASSVQVMRMCEAFAGEGWRVILLTKACAERQEKGITDDFGFYGVLPSFEIRKLPRPAPRGGGLVFACYVYRHLHALRDSVDLVYSRNMPGALAAVRLGLPVIYEAHTLPSARLAVRRLRRLVRAPSFRHVVAISGALRNALVSERLVPADRVLVVHDAGAPLPGAAARPPERDAASGRRLRIGYVGSFNPGKGVDFVLRLARRLPEVDFHLVGGEPAALEAVQAQGIPPNVTLHGFVPHARLPAHYELADMLLMPYGTRVFGATAQSDLSAWMSPLKMFEYMAAARPIVASDLPVLREVLMHEHTALLVPPNDIDGWVSAIKRLAGDPLLRTRLAAAALAEFQGQYTWEARARGVLGRPGQLPVEQGSALPLPSVAEKRSI